MDKIEMDYHLRKSALKDFHLNHKNYITELTQLQDFVKQLTTAVDFYIERKSFMRAINHINNILANIENIIDNPSYISTDDKRSIKRMKHYFNENSGKNEGYYSHRLQKLNYEIERLQEVAIKNNVALLAWKCDIQITAQQLINHLSLLNQQEQNNKLKHLDYTKRIWGDKIIICDCGSHIRRANLQSHERSWNHILWLKKQNISCDDTYRCCCGKIVRTINKAQHERSKFHKAFIKPNVIKLDQNVVLSINENISIQLEEI